MNGQLQRNLRRCGKIKPSNTEGINVTNVQASIEPVPVSSIVYVYVLYTDTNSFRRCNETELKLIHASQRGKASSSRGLKNVLYAHKTITLSMATPTQNERVLTSNFQNIIPAIPSKSLLTTFTPECDDNIGTGHFGTCKKMLFKDMFTVCAKVLPHSVSINALRMEHSYTS